MDYIYAKAEVTVQNGTITRIDILKHKNERGKLAEIVVDRIITEQKKRLMPYRVRQIQALSLRKLLKMPSWAQNEKRIAYRKHRLSDSFPPKYRKPHREERSSYPPPCRNSSQKA